MVSARNGTGADTGHVLFLCERNTVRSPMAAALLAQVMPVETDSAGLAADDMVDPFACAAMAEAGLDITAHTPRTLAPAAIAPGVLVIALAPTAFEAARKWRESADFELDYWDLPAIPSPDGGREAILDGYRAIREALRAHIHNRFANP